MENNSDYNKYVEKLSAVIQQTGISDIVPRAHSQYVEQTLKSPTFPLKTKIPTKINLVSYSLENLASDLYLNSKLNKSENLFEKSFIFRRNQLAKKDEMDYKLLFYFAVSALGAKRTSELRILLDTYDLDIELKNKEWPDLVEINLIRAFLLLCRKKNG